MLPAVRSRALLAGLTLLATVAAGATPAVAARFRHLSIEELAVRCDAAVVGHVTDAQVGWNATRDVIVTTFTIEPEDVLAGDLLPGPLTVTRVGGELDGLALTHAGMARLDVGDRVALFLRERAPSRFVILGLAQGVLRADGNHFVRRLPGDDAATPERVAPGELRRRVEASRGAR